MRFALPRMSCCGKVTTGFFDFWHHTFRSLCRDSQWDTDWFCFTSAHTKLWSDINWSNLCLNESWTLLPLCEQNNELQTKTMKTTILAFSFLHASQRRSLIAGDWPSSPFHRVFITDARISQLHKRDTFDSTVSLVSTQTALDSQPLK